MKRLVYFLILVLTAVRVDAAITFTSRGNVNAATGSTTLAFNPTSTIVVGRMGLALFAVDNVGANGNTKVCTTLTDSGGNTWSQQLDVIYDPGVAAAGVEIAAYTSTITTQLTTSDTITLTFSTSTTGRTGRLLDVAGATGPYFVTAAAISDLLTSGQTGTAVSMTTGSIANGDGVVCFTGSESSTGTTTGDSDTTNGSWAANLSTTATTAPMRLDVQSKVVTGTATQSYDITLGASADWISGWLQFSETAPATGNNATNGFLIWN